MVHVHKAEEAIGAHDNKIIVGADFEFFECPCAEQPVFLQPALWGESKYKKI